MEETQHINIDLDELKHELQTNAADSQDTVLAALSSRIKDSLGNIPEEKRTEVEALVDTFLQKELLPVLSTIVSTHCALTPEVVEILTKEAIAELPSELTHKLYKLSDEMLAFNYKQEFAYESYVYTVLSKKTDLFQLLRNIRRTVVVYCTGILRSKSMKKARTSQFESALSKEKAKLEDLIQALRRASDEKEEIDLSLSVNIIADGITKEKMRIANPTLDWNAYALQKVAEKVKMHALNSKKNPSTYFLMREVAEEKTGRYISTEDVEAFQTHWIYSNEVCSIQEVAEKIKSAEKECLAEGKKRLDAAKAMKNVVEKMIVDAREYISSVFREGPAPESMKMLEIVEKKAKKLQEPEKTEIKEVRSAAVDLFIQIRSARRSFLEALDEISKGLDMDSLEEALSSLSISKNLADFNESFEKIQAKFPNAEAHFNYRKALQNLIARTNRCTDIYNEHYLATKKQLEFLQEVGRDETPEARDIRVSEYEKFAEENPAPDFSGSIEDISSETLENGATPREIEAMLSSLRVRQGECLAEIADEAKTEAEKLILKVILLEIKRKIRVLEPRLLSLANLSEEQAKNGECIRYAYLTKYKSETFEHMAVFTRTEKAEVVPLASEIVKEIEKIPNNPEFSRQVKEMLDEIIEKEPESLLSPEVIIKNEHFLEKLESVLPQLDKEIVKALGGSSGERTGVKRKYHLTLQNSILALFFVFMLLSLGLVCNSEFS
ncbi:uncharacterized protein NEMAJ01_1020 [Nematocida major]|uniref:uncharacterized protein n=1 Tax=Nematocida major TaxID=1912982 RepID=UPI0020075AD9|nr:uncharacterized protein NEMAJ01_1020 [Nematocida major]KAH9386124.1 hypothetical protein NEMAJ01_1020 [Nematocida major]